MMYVFYFKKYQNKKAELLAQNIRIFGSDDPYLDIEPESARFTPDDKYVIATLTEQNALGVFDVTTREWVGLYSMGYVKMNFDPSDRPKDKKEPKIAKSWGGVEVHGMPMSDMLDITKKGDDYYIFTADEGDARDELPDGKKCDPSLDANKDVEGEETRLGDVGHTTCPDSVCKNDDVLGRLKTTTCFPAKIKDGKIDGQVYAYGTRGFSVFKFSPASKTMNRVFSSTENDATNFELILNGLVMKNKDDQKLFNIDDEENKPFARNDDKGAEPEAIVVGSVDGKDLAFVGLERQGGIMVFDVTNPEAPVFHDHLNLRNMCDDGITLEVEAQDSEDDAEKETGDKKAELL